MCAAGIASGWEGARGAEHEHAGLPAPAAAVTTAATTVATTAAATIASTAASAAISPPVVEARALTHHVLDCTQKQAGGRQPLSELGLLLSCSRQQAGPSAPHMQLTHKHTGFCSYCSCSPVHASGPFSPQLCIADHNLHPPSLPHPPPFTTLHPAPTHPPTRDLAPVDLGAVQLLACVLGVLQILKLHKAEGLLNLAALQQQGTAAAGG